MCHGTCAEYGVKGGRACTASSRDVDDDDGDGIHSSAVEGIDDERELVLDEAG